MNRPAFAAVQILGAALCASPLAAAPAPAGVMLGAHVGGQFDPDWKTDFTALESAVGARLAIDNDQEDWALFPNAERVRWDAAHGRRSMLSWRIVFHRDNPAGGCATAAAIVAGRYDAQLDRQAAAARALAVPLLVRFNYEMTNNEENTCFTGFRVKSDPAVAGAKYIAAWKHVVGRFRAAGAGNVKWVWAPGHHAYESGLWRQFYPGGDFVDWIGVDDYNKSDTPASFAADPGILAFYAAAAPLGKPLMVAETGAVNDPRQTPDPQSLWLTTARTYLKAHPAIKAFVYWNNPGKFSRQNPGYGGSGYILQGPGLAAFRAMAADPYFR
ncbi:MAG: glycosyl hydrolase [Caulobacteraceae bacterium]